MIYQRARQGQLRKIIGRFNVGIAIKLGEPERGALLDEPDAQPL